MNVRILIPSLLLATAVGGCTFSDGDAYGDVTGTIEARYDARRNDTGWERLLGDIEIRLLSVELRDVHVELVDEGGEHTDDGAPAHCHGDDCDDADPDAASDGSVALELNAGNLDLLDPELAPLGCNEQCRLDRGHISAVHVTATRLMIAGKVRDRLGEPRLDGEVPFTAGFLLDGVTLERAVDLPLDDDHASNISLALELPLDATLLDAVPFTSATPAPDGTLQLERDADIIAALKQRYSERELGVLIERSDPE